jgi:hypothetical protein
MAEHDGAIHERLVMLIRNDNIRCVITFVSLEIALTTLVLLGIFAFWPDHRGVVIWFVCVWLISQVIFVLSILSYVYAQKAKKQLDSIDHK